jgi:hypothetical protein
MLPFDFLLEEALMVTRSLGFRFLGRLSLAG